MDVQYKAIRRMSSNTIAGSNEHRLVKRGDFYSECFLIGKQKEKRLHGFTSNRHSH